ncbi:MAG: UDP-N-acetylmuramate dehydrogenase [Lachnospiraceae bacterium]|nr:UDP-N-acetylmuramate dehydrogenase [Lachnospiraceae bacterium]
MDSNVIAELRQLLGAGGVILENEPLSRHTTFGVGGPAEVYISVNRQELLDILAYAREREIPYTVIGNGSNLLVSDAGIPGIVLSIGNRMNKVTLGPTDQEQVVITAEAGAVLPSVAREAAVKWLSGLEFASGIPGTIGGAVVMNAGAYGGEMRDVLRRVTVLKPDGDIEVIGIRDMKLGYRTSRFLTSGEIILDADLLLTREDHDLILARMDKNAGKRKASQPIGQRSAGSTFRRVDQGRGDAASNRMPAWQLIQEAGMRNASVGGAAVSEKHSGFIINKGNATATDVYRLIRKVQRAVRQTCGVTLETEVRLLGEFPVEEEDS